MTRHFSDFLSIW